MLSFFNGTSFPTPRCSLSFVLCPYSFVFVSLGVLHPPLTGKAKNESTNSRCSEIICAWLLSGEGAGQSVTGTGTDLRGSVSSKRLAVVPFSCASNCDPTASKCPVQ